MAEPPIEPPLRRPGTNRQSKFRHGASRAIDLYFPLPEALQAAKKMPAFDVVWRVHTAERVVTERTPFERLEVMPYPVDYGYGGYWYDPAYPGMVPFPPR